MEQKLEVKHLAPYLPYGIKIISKRWGRNFKLHFDSHILNCITIYDVLITPDAKPMLCPLSTILEDDQIISLMFDIGGKTSDAIHDWIKYAESDPANIDNAILCAPYPVIEWALEKHIDIFSLIQKGLAVPLT